MKVYTSVTTDKNQLLIYIEMNMFFAEKLTMIRLISNFNINKKIFNRLSSLR